MMATEKRQTREVALTSGTPGTAVAFRQLATRMASDLLTSWVGEERAGEAIGRIATALSASAASAKKPEDFYTCTPASIATCVAIAALTGIMPGHGSTALAYLIPRSPRRGEQKQLGFAFSHRGLAALARRSGQMMKPIPIGYGDRVRVSVDGDVEVQDLDIDNPPTEYDDLRGIVVVVKNLDGTVMARGWMPRVLIDKRRAASDSYTYACKPGNEWAKDSDPWHQWPIEMAMKTAMHYAISRGWCVIDDTSSVRALASDITVQAVTIDSPRLPAPGGLDELTERLTGETDEPGNTETSTQSQQPTSATPSPITNEAPQPPDIEEWTTYVQALKAAEGLRDAAAVAYYWIPRLPEAVHPEAQRLLEERKGEIRSTRGERSNRSTQGKLLDSTPTAQTAGV